MAYSLRLVLYLAKVFLVIALPRSGSPACAWARCAGGVVGARYYVDERDPKVCSIPTIYFLLVREQTRLLEAKIDFVILGLRRPPEDSLQAVSLSPSRCHRLAAVV